MPTYQQVLIARDIAKPADMVKLLKTCAATVYEHGGVMRSVENHGIRALHHRLRNRRANEEEQKYHFKARYVSTYFDASPKVLRELERVLRLDQNVLRYFTIKDKTQADLIRVVKGWKSHTWDSYDIDEMEKQQLRAKAILDEEELDRELAKYDQETGGAATEALKIAGATLPKRASAEAHK